ncbi:hypothetical protein M9H77_31598 [Catharanthus roseus]|uniref:Uncharacterized protein n=1 Tax=Catharanthus roseus TaxID=4058 RepID=A0ACC0A1H3_CATRO|nr:hypothetical protein M9H77_31598 [Catharanthus roseus]
MCVTNERGEPIYRQAPPQWMAKITTCGNDPTVALNHSRTSYIKIKKGKMSYEYGYTQTLPWTLEGWVWVHKFYTWRGSGSKFHYKGMGLGLEVPRGSRPVARIWSLTTATTSSNCGNSKLNGASLYLLRLTEKILDRLNLGNSQEYEHYHLKRRYLQSLIEAKKRSTCGK